MASKCFSCRSVTSASPRRSRVRRTRRSSGGRRSLELADIGRGGGRGRAVALRGRLDAGPGAAPVPRMKSDRAGGLALIAGAIGFIVTMGLHPTAHDLLAPGAFEHAARVNVVAHALAIASMAVAFVGALALTRGPAAGGLGTT